MNISGDENGFSKFGDKKSTAQQKRQDYKQTKSVPQSMEYGEKKSTVESTKPDTSSTLQNLKKTVALLEVPSHFQTQPRCVVDDSMEDLDDQWNPNEMSISSSQETLTELTAKISILTSSMSENDVTDKNDNEDEDADSEEKDVADTEEVVKSNDENEVKSLKDDTDEPLINLNPKDILTHTSEDQSLIGEPLVQDNHIHDQSENCVAELAELLSKNEIKNISHPRKERDKKEISGSDNFQKQHVRKENSERDKNIAGVHDVADHADVLKQSNEDEGPLSAPVKVRQSSLPNSANKVIDATFVDYNRSWHPDTTLAHAHKEKNEPQLVKIRKLEPLSAVDMVRLKFENWSPCQQ